MYAAPAVWGEQVVKAGVAFPPGARCAAPRPVGTATWGARHHAAIRLCIVYTPQPRDWLSYQRLCETIDRW